MRLIPTLAVVVVCGVSAMAARSAQAVLLAYDDFNYSNIGGDLNTNSGGGSFGFSTDWTGQTSFNIGSGSLLSPRNPLPKVGNSVTAVAFGGNRDIDRSFTSSLGLEGTSLYVSVLMQPQGILGQGAFNGWFAMVLRGSTDIVVGKSSNSSAYTLGVGFESATTTRNAVVGRTELFVLRFDFTEGVDPVYLYVNPEPGAPEPATPSVSEINLNVDFLNKVSLSGPGAAAFDSFRVGTTFLDVVPPVTDFDNNGKVDGVDLGTWGQNFGSTTADHSQGDADSDLDVDGTDLLVWQRQLGAKYTVPMAAAVPEPNSALLAAVVLSCGVQRRRRV